MSSCLEIIMNNIGSKNISNLPDAIQKQLFKMLSYFLQDASQDVRINAKKALLTLEYGPDPFDNREQCV